MTRQKAQRYNEKPLLRLLECYTLRAISQLPEAEAARLAPSTGGCEQQPSPWECPI